MRYAIIAGNMILADCFARDSGWEIVNAERRSARYSRDGAEASAVLSAADVIGADFRPDETLLIRAYGYLPGSLLAEIERRGFAI